MRAPDGRPLLLRRRPDCKLPQSPAIEVAGMPANRGPAEPFPIQSIDIHPGNRAQRGRTPNRNAMAELLGPERLQPNGMRTEVAITRALAVLAVLGIVAALYFAKAIFLALAILLTFLLAPAVRLLRNWGVPRVAAVVLVVAFACTVFLGVGALVGQQMTQLAQQLPEYQFTIQEKIRSVRDAASGGTLERISTFLRNVNQEIRKKEGQDWQGAQVSGSSQTAPMPVEIHQPEPAAAQVIQRVLQPLVEPLTTGGLVVIFVTFFLLQRQDLRDRFLKLAGSHDLQRTTEALDDGARRLSRYFLAQTSLNLLFGVIVGTGLTFIGVPNPLLFWIFAMVF